MSAALVESVREAAKAREQAAQGAWCAFTDDSREACHTNIVAIGELTTVVLSLPGHHKDEANLAAIVAAMQLDLPAILAALTEAEALRAQVAQGRAREVALREALTHYDGRAYHSEYESDGQIQWVAENALKSIGEPDTAALRAMLEKAWMLGYDAPDATDGNAETQRTTDIDRVLGGS